MGNQINLLIIEKITVKEFEEYKILQEGDNFLTSDLGLVETLLKGGAATVADKAEQKEVPVSKEDTTSTDGDAVAQKATLALVIAETQSSVDEILAKKAELGDKPLHHATQTKLEKLEAELVDLRAALEALEENFDDEKEF